jgi:hypothetical protein
VTRSTDQNVFSWTSRYMILQKVNIEIRQISAKYSNGKDMHETLQLCVHFTYFVDRMYSSRTHLVYFVIRLARISSRRYTAIRYKFKLSTYILEPSVTEVVYRERFKRENGSVACRHNFEVLIQLSPNSQFRGKYILTSRKFDQVKPDCKLRGTPD